MANASHSDKNRLRSFGGIVLTPQRNCPIPDGAVGLWLDAQGVLQVRHADGRDTVERPLDASSFRTAYFAGIDASGGASHVAIPSLQAGDQVLFLYNITDGADGSASFEGTVTASGQLQQPALDLTTKRFFACFIARS